MSWGSGPWGFTPWGGSGEVDECYATSTNDVFVRATRPLLVRSTVLVGDATNPLSWKIVRIDTNELVAIASVAVLSPTDFLIRTQAALPRYGVELELSSSALDAAGNPLGTKTAAFIGVTEEALSTPAIAAAGKTSTPRDLMNHPVPASPSGTLVVQGGDYATETGAELLRKLVLRRLTARPGDFYHLRAYGVGLRAKQPIPAGDLATLQTAIKQQILQEPDVQSVRVSLTQAANLLYVGLEIVSKKTGQTIEIGAPFPTGASA